ncbi:MAG TPA: hypothetical protein PKW80_07130 [Bacteroidales bacterium]|nr:hypothetical protein [Bacteroidales bacterium]
MKKLLLFFLIFFAVYICYSQTLTREVISTGGDFQQNSSGLLSFTIGETVVETFETTKIDLTQGFQQYDVTKFLIYGKVKYAGKAIPGSPAPNPPSYNQAIFNIDNVIVILKLQSNGEEITRDTSDMAGNYQLSNVSPGNYLLCYDKYTEDTMQWGNGVDAIDVTILKYYIGIDTTVDPSRNFTIRYKKAANVDNNAAINAIDISRIKAKIGSPYTPSKNFPKGNWVALDTVVSVGGSDLNVTLKTICYGDYNASSTKYRDSTVNWSQAKSVDQNIISITDEYLMTTDPLYFELPLRISTRMNEFSALGLELSYPHNDYELVRVSMPGAGDKSSAVTINPTLEEIIASDDDLLVIDEDGVIRVVYATTGYYDVATGAELIRLGFRAKRDPGKGALDFELSGTGVIGNRYGEEDEDAYLLMPRVFVQGNHADTGFGFMGYPNPFDGEVALVYTLPEDGMVKIDAYNAIGEMVSGLVNESRSAGKHTLLFSAKTLPAGMYTFKLEFAGTQKSEQAILKMINKP